MIICGYCYCSIFCMVVTNSQSKRRTAQYRTACPAPRSWMYRIICTLSLLLHWSLETCIGIQLVVFVCTIFRLFTVWKGSTTNYVAVGQETSMFCSFWETGWKMEIKKLLEKLFTTSLHVPRYMYLASYDNSGYHPFKWAQKSTWRNISIFLT